MTNMISMRTKQNEGEKQRYVVHLCVKLILLLALDALKLILDRVMEQMGLLLQVIIQHLPKRRLGFGRCLHIRTSMQNSREERRIHAQTIMFQVIYGEISENRQSMSPRNSNCAEAGQIAELLAQRGPPHFPPHSRGKTSSFDVLPTHLPKIYYVHEKYRIKTT